MDIERARRLAQEKKVFEDRIRQMEPLDQNVELSPQERFSVLSWRIQALSTKTDELGGSISYSVTLELKNDLRLSLSTSYDAVGSAHGRIPTLFEVEAHWYTGKDGYQRSTLALEQLFDDDVNKPESQRVLGLLEESVAVAENEVARKAAGNITS